MEKTCDLVPEALTAGYYYWSLRSHWRDRLNVIFETSDYREMKRLHKSDRIYKLIFHANENLCADWDPCSRVLGAFGESDACPRDTRP